MTNKLFVRMKAVSIQLNQFRDAIKQPLAYNKGNY